MREDLNFNVLPIVDDFNNFNRGLMTNVSSNAYYGYQANLEHAKHKQQCESMDFECSDQKTRNNNRKRAWDHEELHKFKKRRQEDRENKENLSKESQIKLEEELLLLQTHGCSMYHWNAREDL